MYASPVLNHAIFSKMHTSSVIQLPLSELKKPTRWCQSHTVGWGFNANFSPACICLHAPLNFSEPPEKWEKMVNNNPSNRPDKFQLLYILSLCIVFVWRQWRSSTLTKVSTFKVELSCSASSSHWSTAWKHAQWPQPVWPGTSIHGYTNVTSIPTTLPAIHSEHIHSSCTSARFPAVSLTAFRCRLTTNRRRVK